MSPNESQARKQIDAQLTASGWSVQDYVRYNPAAARGIALREVPLKDGRCDYLLIVDRQPLGVIEAKKEGTTLSTVAEQSARYGENLPDFLNAGPLPFYYESTGERRSSVMSAIPNHARDTFSVFIAQKHSPHF